MARDGNWFALLVAAVVVLGAMPFYHYSGPTAALPGCAALASGFICRTRYVPTGLFGTGLGSPIPGAFGNAGPGASTYWVISVFLGLCTVVGFYWFRSRPIGTAGRAWPILTACLGALVLGVASRKWSSVGASEMTPRGMQALLIIALELVALAIIDRRRSFSIFVAGFFALALASCLYDVSNLFQRLGVGTNWPGNDQSLPNLILPGAYLVFGGGAFWIFHFWDSRAKQIKNVPTLT